ncbi:hypothetical protein GCM10027217_06050 [Pseudomaricurvus hydrocarbonicus]
MMQSLGRQYVRYFNQKYERTGTLWEGRYKSSLVDSERYLLMVYQYIELNPVRANMVRHASEYPWSSYQYNAVGRKIELITPHDEYLALGVDDQERQANYRSLFRGKMKQVDLQAIREACQRASILGSEKFIKNFEEKTGRKAKSANRGGDRRSIKFRKLRFQ